MLFTLGGEQATAERFGEADATLMRGGRVAGGRNTQGYGKPFYVLGVGEGQGGFHRSMLTDVAGLGGSTCVHERRDLEDAALHRGRLRGRVAFLVEAVDGQGGLGRIAVASVRTMLITDFICL